MSELTTPRRRQEGAISKTTVNLPTALLDKAKKVAEEEGVTLRELIESGLEHEVKTRRREEQRFRLRDMSFGGGGLRPEWQGRSMSEVIAASYPVDRGGTGREDDE